MTSRVSFPKLVIETLRRHIAAVMITALGFFIHIIGFFMNVQNIVSAEYYTEEYSLNEILSSTQMDKISPEQIEYIQRELQELCSPTLTNGIIALCFGLYLAFDFFRYMHSKRETDFYESLPIRRQTWLKTIFVSCFALFLILCTITVAIETAIVFSTGYGTSTLMQGIMWNYICMVTAFLISWFTTALAMIMTGHTLIAILGYGVFASYIPLILANLIPVYGQRFFDTYVYKNLSDYVYMFSPVSLIYKMTNSWYAWKLEEHVSFLIGSVIYIIIVSVIVYFLFMRRPSEAAGRAMAFEKANSLIRFMLVIPLALYAGLFLDEMSTISSIAWLVFGVIFAAFLLHGIMECIFQFDIKAMICKKKQLLATIVLCLAFVFIFHTDMFKYDEYIPNVNRVKMVKMESHLFDYNKRLEKDWLQGELVDDAIAVVKDIRNSKQPSEDEHYYMDYITVTYVMKNGYEVKREYSYDASKAPESLCKLYLNEDFKDDHCILYHLEPDEFLGLRVNNGVEYTNLTLTDEEKKEFAEIYSTEYTAFEFKQLFTDTALYELYVECPDMYNEYKDSFIYYVYPNFTKTIAFLEERGIISFYESETITLTNMEVFDYYENHKDNPNTQSLYVSDPEQLKELKQDMIINSFDKHRYSDEYLYAEIEVKSGNGISYLSVSIKKADIDKVLEK